MSYTPAWNAHFAKPLLNQAIAIIQRDQQSAIEAVNSSLAPISEFHKGSGMRTAFPWLLITADKLAFDPTVDNLRRSQAKISLALDAGQFDQEMAQDNAADYAHVLDMIMTSASGEDWTTPLPISHETAPSGMTAPGATGSVKRVFVESHNFEAVKSGQVQTPVIRVTLAVLFEMMEE